MIDVNLLPQRNLLSNQEKELRSRFVLIAVIISALLIAANLACFLLNQLVHSRVDSQILRRSQLNADFNARKESAVRYRHLVEKLDGINEIRRTQKDFPKAINDVIQLVSDAKLRPKSVYLDNSGMLRLNASSPNLESFTTLVEFLSKDDDTTPFTNTVLSGVREEAGEFPLSLVMKYKFLK